MVPSTAAEYRIVGQSRNDFSTLKYVESAEIPKLGDHDCLVKIRAVSLNYRDLIIPKVNQSYFPGILYLTCVDIY